jgi:hypothetical protein
MGFLGTGFEAVEDSFADRGAGIKAAGRRHLSPIDPENR